MLSSEGKPGSEFGLHDTSPLNHAYLTWVLAKEVELCYRRKEALLATLNPYYLKGFRV